MKERVEVAVLIDLRAAHEADIDIAALQQQQHVGAAEHHVGALGAALIVGRGRQLPGSTKAPMTPPSNRMVRPGQRRRCASVAASSGMPTPANTTWPSLSCRALRIVSSSLAV